jgi:hypothetical protein
VTVDKRQGRHAGDHELDWPEGLLLMHYPPDQIIEQGTFLGCMTTDRWNGVLEAAGVPKARATGSIFARSSSSTGHRRPAAAGTTPCRCWSAVRPLYDPQAPGWFRTHTTRISIPARPSDGRASGGSATTTAAADAG